MDLPSGTGITRRALLGGAAGIMFGVFVPDFLPTVVAPSVSRIGLVPDAVPASIPLDFELREVVFARFMTTAAKIANAVIVQSGSTDGPLGWIAQHWWRPARKQFPRNARIMEQVSVLSAFLALDRPWNYLKGNEALADRTLLALDYYLSLQNPNGSFPGRDHPDDEGLAATGFGLTSLVATHRNLAGAGISVPGLEDSCARAVDWLLSSRNQHWIDNPLRYTNQLVGALVGAVDAVAEFPALGDRKPAIVDRLALLADRGFSSPGNSHESSNYDFGYSFSVALPDIGYFLRLATSQLAGVPGSVEALEALRDRASGMIDFIRHTVLFEPGIDLAFHYAGISVRGEVTTFVPDTAVEFDNDALGRENDPTGRLLAPMYMTAEQESVSFELFENRSRSAKTEYLGSVSQRSPRRILQLPLSRTPVTEAVKSAALTGMPYRGSARADIRASDNSGLIYAFIRRPKYFIGAAYDRGRVGNEYQRFGPGIAWSPGRGTFVWESNSLSDQSDTWGTVTSGYREAREHLPVTFYRGLHGEGDEVEPGANGRLILDGEFSLVSHGAVETTLTFTDEVIYRSLTPDFDAVHSTPFLLGDDDVVTFGEEVVLERPLAEEYTAGMGNRMAFSGATRSGKTSTVVLSTNIPVEMTLTPTRRVFPAAGKRQFILTFRHPKNVRLGVTLAVTEA